jgi:uncharacterized phiE125 gp8 family phage protein
MNRMRFQIVTPPASEPVTLDELKAQRRISGTDEDTYLTALIVGARTRAENLIGPIMPQTWDGFLDRWPCGDTLTIEKPRLTAVTSVKYTVRGDVAASTLDASKYLVDTVSHHGCIRLKDGESWPGDTLEVLNPIAVRFTAGWATPPQTVKQAILFLASHWHANREIITADAANEIPEAFIALITDYREWGF